MQIYTSRLVESMNKNMQLQMSVMSALKAPPFLPPIVT